jgi:uncharacterized UPF0160 family protein
MPWQEVLVNETELFFVVYPAADATGWKVQAVPDRFGSPGCRKLFPDEWAGKEGLDIIAATGVPDATFCHRNRFIAAADSRGGAERLAMLAVMDGWDGHDLFQDL